MPGPLVVLFWIWVLVSLAIIIYRVLTTGTWRSQPKDSDHKADNATKSRRRNEESFEARKADFEARLAANAPAPEPTPEAPAFTPPSSDSSPDTNEPSSLIDALDGIAMPCELTPRPGSPLDARDLSFSTTTASLVEVSTALVTELERLGFNVEQPDDSSITANNDAAQITVAFNEAVEMPELSETFTKTVTAHFTLV